MVIPLLAIREDMTPNEFAQVLFVLKPRDAEHLPPTLIIDKVHDDDVRVRVEETARGILFVAPHMVEAVLVRVRCSARDGVLEVRIILHSEVCTECGR